jgi:hypothetical protein
MESLRIGKSYINLRIFTSYATPQRNRTKPNQKPKTNNQICEIQNDDLYLTNDVK